MVSIVATRAMVGSLLNPAWAAVASSPFLKLEGLLWGRNLRFFAIVLAIPFLLLPSSAVHAVCPESLNKGFHGLGGGLNPNFQNSHGNQGGYNQQAGQGSQR